MLDTKASCPDVSLAKSRRLELRIAAGRKAMQPEAKRVYGAYVAATAQRLGLSEREVERQCEGVLRPAMVLDFDDPNLASKTVAEVLAEPERFIGATLADPIEGAGYGRGKAKVFQQRSGCVVIHSWAHGLSTTYRLKLDKAAIQAAVVNVKPEDWGQVLIDGIVVGDVDDEEIDELLGLVANKVRDKQRLLAELQKARSAAEREAGHDERFQIIDGKLCYRKKLKDGTEEDIPFTNFAARIVEDQIVDDGVEETRRYRIEGALEDGTPLPDAVIAAPAISGTKWVNEKWGARAIVQPGNGPQFLEPGSRR